MLKGRHRIEGEGDDIDFEKEWHPMIEPIKQDIWWEICDLNSEFADYSALETEVIKKMFNGSAD